MQTSRSNLRELPRRLSALHRTHVGLGAAVRESHGWQIAAQFTSPADEARCVRAGRRHSEQQPRQHRSRDVYTFHARHCAPGPPRSLQKKAPHCGALNFQNRSGLSRAGIYSSGPADLANCRPRKCGVPRVSSRLRRARRPKKSVASSVSARTARFLQIRGCSFCASLSSTLLHNLSIGFSSEKIHTKSSI